MWPAVNKDIYANLGLTRRVLQNEDKKYLYDMFIARSALLADHINFFPKIKLGEIVINYISQRITLNDFAITFAGNYSASPAGEILGQFVHPDQSTFCGGQIIVSYYQTNQDKYLYGLDLAGRWLHITIQFAPVGSKFPAVEKVIINQYTNESLLAMVNISELFSLFFWMGRLADDWRQYSQDLYQKAELLNQKLTVQEMVLLYQ